MATDIKLDDEMVVIEGNGLAVHGADLVMDSAGRRQGGGRRRALVHGFVDELIVNYDSDYPGGVTIRGRVTAPDKLLVGRPAPPPAPPSAAQPGDMRRIRHDERIQHTLPIELDAIGHVAKQEIPIDVAQEIHFLRLAVLQLRERIVALESK